MTNDKIFEDYGIEVLKRNNRYFIRYDEGHIVVEMVEVEITRDEAQKAQMSERDAHEVILKIAKIGKKKK